MPKMIAIGIDHGNGKLKARSTEVKSYIVPSAVALESNVGDDFMGKELDLQHGKVSGDEDTYVWGAPVKSVAKYSLTMGHQDRLANESYKILTELALGALAGKEEQVDAVVVTGVPSNQIKTKEAANLKAFLQGTHLVKVDSREIIIRVKDVFVLPQPVGTIMSLYLDSEGFVKQESYETEKIAVIDIGNGTTDLDYIQGLKRQDEFLSIPTGMYDVYNYIARKINEEEPNAGARAEIVEEYFASAAYKVSKRKVIPFEDIKEKAIQEIGTELKNRISQHWKFWDRFDEIILTGGGAHVFADTIRQLIPDVKVMKEPQFRNADGFYRYAQYIKGVKYDEQSVSTEV